MRIAYPPAIIVYLLKAVNHNQQARTTFNGMQTRQAEQEHISAQSRQMFEGAAAMKLGGSANDTPSCRL
jgi:hypothetical protein